MLIHRAGAWGSLLVVCSNFLCVVGWMRDFGSDVAADCDHGDPLGQTPRQKLQQNQDLPMPPSGTVTYDIKMAKYSISPNMLKTT